MSKHHYYPDVEEPAGGDFYAPIDAAFDKWHAGLDNLTMGNSLPIGLAPLDPKYRPVQWRDRRYSRREHLRSVHPEVAAEAERLDAMEGPSEADCSKLFGPSKLACFRAGWSEGVNAEKARNNASFVSTEHSALRNAIERKGADYARALLDKVIAEKVRQDEA